MTTFEVYRTARTAKQCENYPRCERGIQPGERYLRASATPHDDEVNQGDHWWTLVICCEHMRPEPAAAALGVSAPTGDDACECPPCPGRGNDGHGLTHCAECCFGTGIVADIDCPTHGAPSAPTGDPT